MSGPQSAGHRNPASAGEPCGFSMLPPLRMGPLVTQLPARPRRAARSATAECREVAGGVPAYLGAGDGEDFCAVHRAHDLAAPGRNSGAQEEAVEVDALIAQRIALVDADDRGRESRNVLGGRERWPGKRVAPGEGLDPVADGAAVVVQVEQDPVVLS